MDNTQIAHDLAVARLASSELPVKELCEKYNQYCNEILEYLNSKPVKIEKATVTKSPF